MSLPGHRGVSRDAPLSVLEDNRFTVNISLTRDCMEYGTATEPWTLKWIHTEPDEYDSVDWYGVFSGSIDVPCKQGAIDYLLPGRFPGIHTGYEYKIERRIDNATAHRLQNGSYAGIHRWFKDELPSFWLGNGDLTPSLSPPIQPEFGWYMTFKTQVAQKRFIVSSPLWDSVTGSDPTYSTSSFFAPSIIRREAMQTNVTGQDSSTTIHATGRLATKGFKERLQERYHNTSQRQNQAESWGINDRSQAMADVNQFLLDFVVDMGPASTPRRIQKEMNAGSNDSEDERQYKPVRRSGDVEAGDAVRLKWKNVNDSLSRYVIAGRTP
ncbi:hypothetical protein RSOL_034290 [Rhizoctonia solani AG-3 Rhs1AP]|uniref:Uncharacterized protein n=1 Tax=Rhizoctonia solani AG-3 Rhs1AP TaxID=1086054 RepID=X8IYE8_9AGAM|nr:hypothetical protein RSOL_034290 [Rhizoctonia solani AG-3 Rhs1AP]